MGGPTAMIDEGIVNPRVMWIGVGEGLMRILESRV